jgi:NodT family efflux transporter outer membrane factor (OMF) lipoprotein
MMKSMPHARLIPVLLAASALAACEVGPNYHRPAAPTPSTYREIDGFAPAQPSDVADRADWWTVFGDPTLDDLERQVATSNQTLAAAEAAYRQARALVAEQRAAFWPTITLGGRADVSHTPGGGATIGQGGGVVGAPRANVVQDYTLQLGGTWEPDLWGKVRRSVENARANAQASAADAVNARLSAEMELAADYITLRQLDEEKRIDEAAVQAYQASLQITQNKYKAGTVSGSDVAQAQTQLHNQIAATTALENQRAQMENAIAVLVGRPADLSIAPAAWTLKPVDIPPGVPSTLLQRRPDIAASERLAEAASAQIGVATAGYFPNLTLTGNGGTEATKIAQLFNPQTFFWNAGASALQTLFNGGLTHAQVQASRAGYDQAVANYRQTVLTAFGQVENNLAAQRVLAAEQPDLQDSVRYADEALRIARNQYQAGTVDYLSVVVVQAAALNAHNAELALEASRLTTTVDLIVALGGGWNAHELSSK